VGVGGDDIEQAHASQVALGARAKTIAADLVAGKVGLVQQQGRDAGTRQVPEGGAAGGARANDDHVRVVRVAADALGLDVAAVD